MYSSKQDIPYWIYLSSSYYFTNQIKTQACPILGIPRIIKVFCFLDSVGTVAVWTRKKFLPLLIRPQGSQGCQKITFFFSQIKVSSFCAKIAPKRHKLKKTIKIEEKMSKKPCFLRYFRIFFNFGAILAPQTSTGMFSGSWRIF
jgi:hypothetical protein